MVELMISMGSNLLATNEKKQTPFDLALEHDNINCLQQLSLHIKLADNPQLLHKFKFKIFDDRYKNILVDLINRDDHTKNLINYLDSQGFTPFLRYVDEYVCGIKDFLFSTKIRDAINRAFERDKDVGKINITNIDLYVFEESKN